MVETTNSPDSGLEKEMEISNSSEDRISKLPDSLIHHILSFLDDIKYVVQTTLLLSERWSPLWKSISNLNFLDSSDMFYSRGTERISRFIQFVNTVLLLRNSSDIKKFYLSCSYPEWETQTTDIYTWILVAVRSNVQELSIRLPGELNFKFPPSIFTCTSLKYLRISMFDGDITEHNLNPMDLPKLEYLGLYGLSIDENLTNKIFSSCPSLKTLLLDHCCVKDSDMYFNIFSPKLKHLTLEKIKSLEETKDVTVKLYAPELRFFSCKDYISREYDLDSFDCLETADIEMAFSHPYEPLEKFSDIPLALKELRAQHMMNFVRALHNVKDLTLSAGFLEVMMGMPNLVHSPPIQFHNLRCLKLDTWLSGASFRAITYLLQISPNIEYLSLQVLGVEGEDQHFPYVDKISLSEGDNVECWEAGSSLLCILYHLKFVKIKGLLGGVNELKFLEILLKNSVVLEKVILSPSYGLTEERAKKFREMLPTFPRPSGATTTMILFNP